MKQDPSFMYTTIILPIFTLTSFMHFYPFIVPEHQAYVSKYVHPTWFIYHNFRQLIMMEEQQA